MNLIDLVEEKSNKNLNIFTYFKKIEEIEILKNILLDENQINILDYISYPLVSSNLTTNKIETQNESTYPFKTKKFLEQIKISYDKLSSSNFINKQDQINKLLDLFMKEVEKY